MDKRASEGAGRPAAADPERRPANRRARHPSLRPQPSAPVNLSTTPATGWPTGTGGAPVGWRGVAGGGRRATDSGGSAGNGALAAGGGELMILCQASVAKGL